MSMRLRTFSAPTMAQAMALVRQEMGENAIIVSTQAGSAGHGARVTAALDEPDIDDDVFDAFDAWDQPARTAPAAGDLNEIQDMLAYHNVPGDIIDRLVRTAEPFEREGPVLALAAAFDQSIAFQPLSDYRPARPLMLVGPPGAGKTIACAKLITRARRLGQPVMAITTDTKRAGGVEQLAAFTRILGVDLVTAPGPTKLAESLAVSHPPFVVIDTPGINPFSAIDMESLQALADAANAETIPVLPAGNDPLESEDQVASLMDLGTRRCIFTRVDLARRLGSLVSACIACRLALAEISISARVAEGLTPLNPVSLARLLVPSADRASSGHNEHEEAMDP